ncbi:putative Ribose/xylose/arabinose/galactoside ABC-type transport system, permease component [Vibrio nigripulchritudo SFn27]|uniref:Ribose/xylose/arabinose/galactoside ABC-type transport system, permease component n=2 Tax=Vibrio nigripulchritudo TaxID=28173 RepID=A0AAV2VNY5_9VIBR|nr:MULTISPECIES: ABC transporter permease [Vibrio]UAB69541.1 ABC transporter permease [Vibrio sp. SCSIO 43132]CCN85076.1 putative Ribose/xylose/arabinose/galactoside ABC-type transport system, permease component [Vibrio nigripulchritudo BLFn1]CCN90288.1 putative Ribose/xylose/arabinose/galactoside ABC-type transport system, permease component [Vibrio nigripulchritudo SFn27]CCN94099.1 putative Ribose/xylose/arabinose/galactoside ABC-type transport system, permease component [Vibrio nigripulchrit
MSSSTTVSQIKAQTTPQKVFSVQKLAIRLGAFVALLGIMIYFALSARGFTSAYNLQNIVEQSAILGFLAFAMTVVFVATGTDVQKGGIDLSVAANAGLCSAVYAVMLKNGYTDIQAIPLTITTGLLVGLLNGFAVVTLKILPLLSTLAVMNIAAGLELVVTQNSVVGAESPLLDLLTFGSFLGISSLSWCLIVGAVLISAVMHFSPLGLRMYAVGGNIEAAKAAGINTGRYIYGSYLFSGFAAGVTSILIVARLSASTPGTSLLLLPVLAAALLGAVFSRRFVPTIGGTLIAVLFIGSLSNGFQLLGISSYWVSGVQGALILIVVAFTSFAKKS